MDSSTNTGELLDAAARVLLRCFVASILFLLFWFLGYLAAGDILYGMHAPLFDLSPHEFKMMNYGGMGLLKLAALVLFLIPYLAIRWARMRPTARRA